MLCLGEDGVIGEQPKSKNIIREKNVYYKNIFILVINKLDAQNFGFTIGLFHSSTCFEHMCSKHVEA